MASTPPRAATWRAFSTASRVEFEVAPATMGTRPPATSTAMSMTRSHSSGDRVGVSPVVPQGTRKSMPDSTCQATNDRSAGSSMEPSCRNGVMRAVPHPRSFIMPNHTAGAVELRKNTGPRAGKQPSVSGLASNCRVYASNCRLGVKIG